MSCFKLKWKLPPWLRFRGKQPERQRHNLPVPERIVPKAPPSPPPPSPEERGESEGPGFYRLLFRGRKLKLEAWEELDTDLPFGAVAYHRAELTAREDEDFCQMFHRKKELQKEQRLAEWNRKSWFFRVKKPEEVELIERKKLLKQIGRDIKRLGKCNQKLTLEFLAELKELLAALSECDNPRLVSTLEERAPEEMDPLEGTSDSYLSKQFRKAPHWKPKLCEPWAEPCEPLTPEELERRQKAQRNRFHSDLSPNDREMWKLSKWHYDRRPEHEQEHYLQNHELPSRPGQFELEDLQRALAPPLPGTPDYSDEMASTDSEEVREAIAAEHRESRRAGKREFSLPAHLKNFDPFAEDTTPKIPTVVASAPATVQKSFPVVIDDKPEESANDAPEVVPEAENDADDESETSFVDSELDLIVDVNDLLELALANISADEDAQNSDEGKPKVNIEADFATNEPAANKSPVQTIKLVMIEVEPNPPTPTNVVIVQAEVHPEPEANDEVPPPLPVKQNKRGLRQLVHLPEDPDKIEVDKSFIEPPKPNEYDDPELDGAAGLAAAKVPRCLRNIRWSFFKPLQHPKNPPGMSKQHIVEQDLGEI